MATKTPRTSYAPNHPRSSNVTTAVLSLSRKIGPKPYTLGALNPKPRAKKAFVPMTQKSRRLGNPIAWDFLLEVDNFNRDLQACL